MQLDQNKVLNLSDNAMLKHRMDLWEEWDFTKNESIGLDIYKVSKGSSNKKVWWTCLSCKSSYDATVSNRISRNQNCPYCSGRRVNHTNSLQSLNPVLALEWHPRLNKDLTTNDVTCNSTKKVWWIGNCGHEWEAVIHSRIPGRGCPVCNNKKILVGFNDMWTTNPTLASMLLNHEDGYKYTQRSGQKADWKCTDCGGVTNKRIAEVNKEGIKCVSCSDGFSIPEKVMYNLLKFLNFDFKHDIQFAWSNNKRYDFYIPSLNIIIETHGGQHSGGGFKSLGGRSLEEEIENDREKKELAIIHGIVEYIEIDTRCSEFVYVKESILKSRLSKIFTLKNVEWTTIAKKSQTSLSKIACDYWNGGMKDIKAISDLLSVHERTVIRYLSFWGSIGKSDFCEYNFQKRKIVQLSRENELINTWSSIADAINNVDSPLTSGNISKACQGKRNTVGGFKWMYLEDYSSSKNND